MCRGKHDVIPNPEWLGWRNGETLTIDLCISRVLQEAWRRGVRTLGSCCGHYKENPSLILTEDRHQPDLAREVLKEIDPEIKWTLYQWQLVDVS